MSTIPIPDLSARASARLGSRYQVAALARRSRRPELDRYQPTRAPWAHAFWPGLDHRLGKLAPADAILDAAIDAVIDPAHEEDVRALLSCPVMLPRESWTAYNSRLVSPKLGLSAAEQRRCALVLGRLAPVLKPGGRAAAAEAAPEEPPYTILDTGGVVSLDWFSNRQGLGTQNSDARVVSTPAPIYLTGCHVSPIQTAGSDLLMHVTIEPLGLSWSWADGSLAAAPMPPVNIALGILVDVPQVLRAVANGQGVSPLSDTYGANVILAYRHVRGLRARSRIASGAEPYEGPVSPYIQLDPSVAAVFDAAGIPDEWYITRPGEPLALP